MSNANQTQAEQLKQIGEQLRQTREQQGIALDQVALKTFIPLRLLQAIEDGELGRLPEPIFVQGFIRRYADLLGLDGVELSKQFPVDTSPTVPVVLSKADQSVPLVPLASTPIGEVPAKVPLSSSRLSGKAARQFWPWAIAGSVALLVLGAAIASLRRPQPAPSVKTAESAPTIASPAPTTASPEGSPSSLASVSPLPTTSPLGTVNPTASPQPTVSPTMPSTTGGPVQVSLNTTDRAWVEIVADGKRVFSGTLEKGEQKAWTANKSLTVTSGNAGAVQLSYNNSPAKSMGKLGEVQEVRFKATTP